MKKIFFILSLICITMFIGCSNPANSVATETCSVEGEYVGTLTSEDGSTLSAGATFEYRKAGEARLLLKVKDETGSYGKTISMPKRKGQVNEFSLDGDGNLCIVYLHEKNSKIYSGTLNKK